MRRILFVLGLILSFPFFSYADEIQVRLILTKNKLVDTFYDVIADESNSVYVSKEVLLSISKNSDIEKVEIGKTEYNGSKLVVYCTDSGKEKLMSLTQKYSGQQIAMVFNGQILTAPYIRDPIKNGIIEIQSSWFSGTDDTLSLLIKSIGFVPSPEVDTSRSKSSLFGGEKKERLLDAASDMAARTPRRESDVNEVYRLVNEGVDVNIKDNNGLTPLMMVIGAEDMELIKLLISKGADVNAQDDYGTTALMKLAKRKDDVALAELLISHGANVDIKDEEDRTALMIAVEKSNYKLAKLFIAQGANVTLKDKLGRTLLMHGGSEEFADLLISKGVDINAQDSTGRTVLMWEAWAGHESFVEYLVAKGADLELKDKNGLTALTLAITMGERGVAEYLRSKTHDLE